MDVRGSLERIYVVQTATKVIERCLLMTTDPGDLVLDPTCGSGTTAYVAEQWGRRWITIDTSRVALALAKQRLLTARFPYCQLRRLDAEDLNRNPRGTWLKNGEDDQPRTFLCQKIPHITLKSIARNTSLDPIFAKHETILKETLFGLNSSLKKTATDSVREKLASNLAAKVRSEGVRAVTEAEVRRWLLPGTKPSQITESKAARFRERIPPQKEWREWEVPFDRDPEWPRSLQDALAAYRQAWRAKMDEVNACVAANAEMEELVDKSEEVNGVVRVSGPFTVEGVIAVEDGPDTPIGGAPEKLETFDGEADTLGETNVVNAEAHLDKIIRLLKASGVDFSGNKNMKFARLEPITGASLLHAEGEWENGDKKNRRVAVSIGPEVGNLTAYQVEDAIRSANRKGYDDVVFAAFGFDAAAQAAIQEASHPNLRLHMALIRPDVAMGELLKTQPGSQLFTVFSAPRIKGPTRQKDGQYILEVEGMDVYDPVSNALYPTDKQRIAAWFLDSDYDGRTFCICQAFFPDKSKWSRLAKALGDKDIIEEEKFEALSGLQSLPFPRPARLKEKEKWRVAVKVIDPRGNEGMRVLTMTTGKKDYD
jgi:adenine-specific DNA-methyltransferase